MKQEQKPFEIKDPVDVSTIIWGEVRLDQHKAVNYINAANAEIRRLQAIVADAPSWGEWVDATVENIESSETSEGFYEFEWDNGGSSILFFTNDCSWLNENGNDVTDEIFSNDDDIMPVRFRRLNYEPKPAREAKAIAARIYINNLTAKNHGR